MRLAEIAPLVSASAFLFSAILVVVQLRNVRRDRFVAITSGLFQVWQTPDFMQAQLWIIHEMKERSWKSFYDRHAGKEGEAALLRVTGFYNRLGTLIRLRLVDSQVLLRTTGWTAYLVWRKMEPLLEEARRENPEFLTDFERIIPLCRSCIGEPEGPAVAAATD